MQFGRLLYNPFDLSRVQRNTVVSSSLSICTYNSVALNPRYVSHERINLLLAFDYYKHASFYLVTLRESFFDEGSLFPTGESILDGRESLFDVEF